MAVRILRGDCRDMLKTLPAESVHCCITSPPYWGLRDYGIPPSIWGGDPACAHTWSGTPGLNRNSHKNGGLAEWSKENARGGGHKAIEIDGGVKGESAFCSCGAWRGCLGLEPTPDLFVAHMVEVFQEVRRVLRPDGTLWLNLGDCYATGAGKQIDDWCGDRLRHRAERRRPHGQPTENGGGESQEGKYAGYRGDRNGHEGKHGYGTGDGGSVGPAIQPNRLPIPGLKPKDLVMVPERVVLALQADGWWVRSRIPWLKRNSMPESVTDRPANATEYVFLLSKSERYFYDREAVKVNSTERASGNKTRFVAKEGERARTNTHLGSAIPFDPDGTGRARRNSDWFFESWQGMLQDEEGGPFALIVNPQPFKEAHFATFPPKLIEPMILAGTSSHGCCKACGAPWVRNLEVAYENVGNRASNGPRSVERKGVEFGTAGFEQRLERRSSTKGWAPTCDCGEAGIVPATVLDPFGGAGTTGLVADRLGRDAILTELKPDYADIASRRIVGDAPLFTEVSP